MVNDICTSPTTTILIRTKNEAKYIGKTLDILNNQSIKPNEIIVVDSGSTDGTVEIVKQRSDIKLIQISPEEFTFGGSLNIGFKAATGEIILLLSAHAFPYDQHWLQNMVKHFDDQKVAGVYGKQLPQPDAWPTVERDHLMCYKDEIRIQTDPDNIKEHSFSNANSAIRRLCWEKHNFDEILPACEDREWAVTMLKMGYKIIYEPSAAVYHSHNESLLKVYRRIYKEIIGLQSIYQLRVGRFYVIKNWATSVLADFCFIVKNKKRKFWLLRVPIYRLFWSYGFLRASFSKNVK
ncbi:glycosyltransferase family 2 protein [Gloeothece verrucosa]|uniref:Glycosyl transferase family 2 n=1 Tax=Gloeothece verrucosa (strain PCC 7822) TaxID=497965 RepID=E0ULK0_GLOV7|nr:glycosyltransferase [Gloeothece verrucosa]ADN17830.1 glycosyl transferase family 2 [Gloeothece verrucosa PCC 7822]